MLDPALRPAHAYLMATEKMQSRAKHLSRVLNDAGVSTTTISIENEHSPACLEQAFLDLAATLSGPVTVNLTGGTKLMALAAREVAKASDWRSFYVDLDTDTVIQLDPRPRDTEAGETTLRLSSPPTLKQYLLAHGFERGPKPQSPPLIAETDALIEDLILNIATLSKPLGQFNGIAQRAENGKRLRVTLTTQERANSDLLALIQRFEAAGMLELTEDQLRFPDAAALAFTKGGWLERHVLRKVATLREELGIRDQDWGVTVTDEHGVRNELDVAFIARNRLFVIECKTARMDNVDGSGAKANDTLFKLSEICRRVGGLGTRAMLVSYRELRKPERQLADALQVRVVAGGELMQLGERLHEWVR